MRKSLIKVGILLLIVCLALSSCGLLYTSISYLLIGQNVTYVDNKTDYTILYEGKKYTMEPNGWFNGTRNSEKVTEISEDITLGMRPDFDSELFYSYTYEDPLYIYSTSCNAFFFREDYDPTKDMFVIEGTSDTISFSSLIADPEESIDSLDYILRKSTKVYLHSESHPNVGVELRCFFIEDDWYWTAEAPAFLQWDGYSATQKWYRITDEVRELLMANNLLPDASPET